MGKHQGAEEGNNPCFTATKSKPELSACPFISQAEQWQTDTKLRSQHAKPELPRSDSESGVLGCMVMVCLLPRTLAQARMDKHLVGKLEVSYILISETPEKWLCLDIQTPSQELNISLCPHAGHYKQPNKIPF